MSYYDSVRDRSVVQMVRDALAWPDNDVVAIFPSGEFTRDVLTQRCDALRDELVGRGVRPQSRVAYVGNPDACIMIAQFAIALAGGVPVPLPERSSQDAWADLVSVTGASFVVCETGQRDRVASMMEDRGLVLPVIEVTPDGTLVSPLGAQPCSDYECTPSGLAEVVLSSGSTGTPKAFAFTQDVEYYFVSTWLQIYGEREGGRFLSVGLSGCMHSLLSCLLRREVFVAYAAPMTAVDFARTIERHRITDAFVPPFILDDLADLYVEGDIDFSSLQRIAYAGQAMPASEKQAIAQKIDCELVQFYGNTESGLLACLGPDDHRSGDVGILASAGVPFSNLGTCIQVWDFNTGEPLGAGAIGRVMVRGRGVTRRIMGADADFMVVDGWRDTEDAGYLDESGRLYVKGRACDALAGRDGVLFAIDIEGSVLSHSAVSAGSVQVVADAAGAKHVFAWVELASGENLQPELFAVGLARDCGISESLVHVTVLDEIPRLPRPPYKVDKSLLKGEALAVLNGTMSATA
ncbi:class I adenylate-forming enzyme family protein [Denitrobacterium detoxificans]|uniref:class I adenylate-forming enzyme family protein n=1 Tax=Denitrobacterium detoxificans TaxID=79604 RepID=UPI0026EE9E1D|nr:fatty acid--CoA ligase family protein [Denitrobacterium detoxificans]